MIHYLLINPDGSILQRGVSDTEEHIPCFGGASIEIIEEDDPRKPKQWEPTYADLRRMEYPSIPDQLGAIWKLLAAHNLLEGEALELYKRIQAVKDSRPKD